jgi:hypothetical protein
MCEALILAGLLLIFNRVVSSAERVRRIGVGLACTLALRDETDVISVRAGEMSFAMIRLPGVDDGDGSSKETRLTSLSVADVTRLSEARYSQLYGAGQTK